MQNGLQTQCTESAVKLPTQQEDSAIVVCNSVKHHHQANTASLKPLPAESKRMVHTSGVSLDMAVVSRDKLSQPGDVCREDSVCKAPSQQATSTVHLHPCKCAGLTVVMLGSERGRSTGLG